MIPEKKKIVRYFVLPYFALSFVAIVFCAILCSLISPSFFELKYYHAIVPIILFLTFKYSICRLPLIFITPKSIRMGKFESCSILILCGFFSSIILSTALNYGSETVININNIDETVGYPNTKYFHLNSGDLPLMTESFYYATTSQSYRGPVNYEIQFYYGGLVGNLTPIYLYSTGVYMYGRVFDSEAAFEISKVARDKELLNLQRLLNEGGYIVRQSDAQKTALRSKIPFMSNKQWAKVTYHFGVTENPRSTSSLLLFFSIVFGCLSVSPAFLAYFMGPNRRVISAIDKQEGYFNKLFNHKFPVW